MTLTYFTARSTLVTYAFLWEKVKTVDFSETITACDLKVDRCRQLIEIMRYVGIEGQGHFFTYIFQVLYVLCFTRPRYQVSVYRTIGPLVNRLIIASTVVLKMLQNYVQKVKIDNFFCLNGDIWNLFLQKCLLLLLYICLRHYMCCQSPQGAFFSSVKFSMYFFSVCSLCACVACNLIKAFCALDET